MRDSQNRSHNSPLLHLHHIRNSNDPHRRSLPTFAEWTEIFPLSAGDMLWMSWKRPKTPQSMKKKKKEKKKGERKKEKEKKEKEKKEKRKRVKKKRKKREERDNLRKTCGGTFHGLNSDHAKRIDTAQHKRTLRNGSVMDEEV